MRNQLLEKSAELKDMEARLKTAESTAQRAAEREDFILSELAAIVSDLDCKFVVSIVSSGAWSITPSYQPSFLQVSKKTQLKNTVTSKNICISLRHIAPLPSGPKLINLEYY